MRSTKTPGQWFGRLIPALILALVPTVTCRTPGSGSRAPGPAGFPTPTKAHRTVGAAPSGGSWAAPDVPPRPVRVVFKSPVRRATGKATVQVTFDQPMVHLGRVKSRAEDPGRYPIEIRPPVKAEYRWVTGDTLKVSVTEPLRNATRYRVRILPSLRSLVGTKLAKPVSWSFETPRPRVWSVSRVAMQPVKARHIHPKDRIEVRFNQRVTPLQLSRALKVRAGGRRVAVTVERHAKDDHRLLVVPRAPLPRARGVSVRIARGLRGAEGDLVSVRPYIRRFRVYSPLSTLVRCDGKRADLKKPCWPMQTRHHSGLTLRFSEPVTRRALLSHLQITPPIKDLAKRLAPAGWSCHIRGRKKLKCAEWWAVSGHLQAARGYRVTFRRGLKDVWGQTLAKATTVAFRTRDFPPGIHVPRGGEAFREAWHPWKFQGVNARDVEAELFVYTGGQLAKFLTCLRKETTSWTEECVKGGATAKQRFTLRGPRNRLSTARVRLPGGLVGVRLSSPQVLGHDGKPVHFHRLAIQTDLGLHVRLSAYGLTAWVTSLRTGRPVKGVRVAAYDRGGFEKGSGVTDAGGLLFIPRGKLGGMLHDKKPPSLVVIAQRGRDLAYVTPGRADEFSRYHQAEWGAPDIESVSTGSSATWRGDAPQRVGHISTERGIYRPGHRVHVHGAVRQFVAWKGAPAKNLAVEVRLVDSTGRVVDKRRLRTNDWGVFLTHFEVPRVGRQGKFHVSLRVGKNQLAYHRFRVAEYRAPRFTSRVDMTPDPVLADGQLTVRMSGRYLFGGAMGGAGYRLSIRRSLTRETWKRWKGYYAGVYNWTLQGFAATWHRSEGALDDHGRRVKRLALAAKGAPMPWPCVQRATLEVWSAARRTASSWDFVTMLPGERLVAIKGLDARVDTVRFHVRVVDPKGRPFAAKPVHVELFAVKKGSSWRPKVLWKRMVWSHFLDVPRGGATLAVRWPKGYKQRKAFLRLGVRDAKGRLAYTGVRVVRPTKWILQNQRVAKRRRARKAELTVSLDKKQYLPGQVAQVTVTRSRAVRSALLLVERERIFLRTPLRFNTRGVARVPLPVRPAYARSVTVRVVGVRAGKALRGAKGPLLSQTAELRVSDEPYSLDVALETDRKAYRPGDKVRVKLQVRDELKRPRQTAVVLMAVDEAVLNLTGYHLPDPYHDLAYTPEDGVQVEDVRAYLARLGIVVDHLDHTALRGVSGGGVGGMGGMGMGGGGGGSGRMSRSSKKRPRRNFKTTAWHHSLVTDAQGRATATFTLPDNVTSYRIMAFAVDPVRSAGTGRTRFEVNLPLLTLPALPRFLREGDSAAAGVVLYNTGLAAGTATVSARVKGDAVTLSGPTTKRVRLEKGRAKEVRFALRGKRPGTSTFTFSVQVAGVTDQVVWPLTVTRPVVPEAASVSGETKGAVRHGIEKLAGLRPSFGGLEVSLTSTALAGVEDGMDQLIRYPYGCLEQTSSRLLPLIAAVVMGERFSLKLPGKPKPMIRNALTQVLAMQRSDGGFGYWPKSRISWPWATAYALVVMHRAAKAARATGVPVPRRAVRRAVRFLKNQVRHPLLLGRYWYSYQAMLLYALRLHGVNVSKKALVLYGKRRRQPLFARALVLETLARGPRSAPVRKAITALVEEMGDSLKIDGTTAHAEEGLHVGYQVMMHSNDRTTAMVLMALLRARPKHALISKLVRWFLVGRKQARFRNTQEAAWALMAFWDFAEIREKDVPDFEAGIWLGRTRVIQARFRGRSVKPVLRSIPMRELMRVAGRAAQDLIVAKRGRGTLYYVARLRYARQKLPTRPRDHGFAVTKEIQVLDRAGRPLKVGRAPKLGDTVLVTLRVKSNEARRYVVVDDPIPAGMEALDTSLATSSGHGAGNINWRTTSRHDHRELRDDRALFFRDHAQPGTLIFRYLARVTAPGRFLAPPTRAAEMYNPEIFGHTATGRPTYAPR